MAKDPKGTTWRPEPELVRRAEKAARKTHHSLASYITIAVEEKLARDAEKARAA